jgi:hypothetical protein
LGSSLAQPASNPTDRQLQAAYCLGAVQGQFAQVEALKLSPPSPPRTLDAILAGVVADEAKYGRPPPDNLLARAKSIYDSEIKAYDVGEKNWSDFRGIEKRRQRLYSYLMASGALDYLVTAPLASSGIDIARGQGAADQQQCVAARNSDCPNIGHFKPGLSKDEMDRENQEFVECFRKSQDNTPACVKWTRCNQFEAELPF